MVDMTAKKRLALAWAILPAPVVLFIPAFDLASRGPAASSYPLLIVLADALFVVMEGTAFWLFIKTRPVSLGSAVGSVLAVGMVALCVSIGLLLVNARM